ncbi:MAG: histidine phosphatase family protein [Deltaproteobacteria bacterium]|nr:histidine phosphatase family protein [Deltaproteobacteria bacterium]
MPRTLILMRHARQSELAVRDHDRPLTNEGRKDAFRVGERLAEIGPIPGHVLSSTALRCRQTWDAVATGLAASIEADFVSSLYSASSRDLLDALHEVEESAESLLILAHNPGMSMLGLELAAARESDLDLLRAGFTPATTACFEVDGTWSGLCSGSARLIRFEPPPEA